MEKCGSQEPDVVLHSLCKITTFNLFSVLNGKFDRRLNFHPRLAWTYI